MRRVRLLLTAIVLQLLGAGSAGAAPSFERGRVEIRTGERVVRLSVELAQTDSERARGLMHRRSLPRNAGMLFVYGHDTDGPFWMKNTRIPLSIAFMDSRGRILRILHMTPCRRDPCPLYSPRISYRSALEVNRGAFTRWGVEPGDVVKLRR